VTVFVIHTDGGARGNPGPAAIGVVLEQMTAGGQLVAVEDIAEVIGVATNNVAEYRALIRGLEEARRRGGDEVRCFLDSLLVVEQMKGRYQVRSADLRGLHDQARALAAGFRETTFTHVPREQNAGADRLVNQALDATAGLKPAELAPAPAPAPAPTPPAGATGWRPLDRPGSRGVEARLLLREGDRAIALLRLAPGASIDEHAADTDTRVVCLEGEGHASSGSGQAAVRAGDVLRWPRGEPHRLWTEAAGMMTLMLEGWD